MTKRRENEFKKSSSNLKHNPLVVLPHLPLLLTVPIMWPLDQAMNLSSHFTLKPWSSSTNSCNEEGVRYFIFLYYSLAERTSSSETKSEYLRHYEELKGWEKKKTQKQPWLRCYLDALLPLFLIVQIIREMFNLLFSTLMSFAWLWSKQTKSVVIKKNIIPYCKDWHIFACFDKLRKLIISIRKNETHFWSTLVALAFWEL